MKKSLQLARLPSRPLHRLAAGAGVALLAGGMNVASAAETALDGARLEEVIVTAQKRVERLQTVAISAQVFGGATLAEQNLTSLDTLTDVVPGVHVDSSGGGRTSSLVIRGIGSGGNQSFDQSVGLFIDDIYHGRSRFTVASFLDLDRVEILKGPQSTFFGNNAIAGALNIVTRKPGETFEASTRALYGEDAQYALEGTIGGPVTETFGARLAVIADGQDGWLEDTNAGHDAPRTRNVGGRLSLVYEANDDLEAVLKIEASRDRSAPAFQLINCPAPAPYPAGYSFGTTGDCPTAQSLGVPIGLDTDLTAESGGQLTEFENVESVLSVNYEKWGHTFSSVSGYYDYDFNLKLDADILPPDLINVQAPENYHQFSQELRITSPGGGRVEYLAGAYFQTGKLYFRQDFNLFFIGPFIGGLPLGQQASLSQDEDDYAVFGSATWSVTDRLKLTGGLRGSWVDKSGVYTLQYGSATQQYGGIVPYSGDLCTATSPATGDQLAASIAGPACRFSLERSDNAWSPSAKVQYEISDDAMTYLRFDKAFKAGGFNGADTSGNPESLPFDPEHVKAYELGLKSEWLDNSVLVNVAVFRSNFRDLQVPLNRQDSVSGAFLSVVRNAAASRSQGVEVETQWAVNRDFRLSANVVYLDSRYLSYPDVNRTNLQSFCAANAANAYCVQRFKAGVGAFQDLSGQRTPESAKWSGNLTGTYSMMLPGDLQLTTELRGFYTSDRYLDVLDHWAGAYLRLDARLILEKPDGRWALDLIGKNLTDRQIASSTGGAFASREPYSNVALQFRYHW